MSRPSLTEENAKFRLGQGDWAAFNLDMSQVQQAATDWGRQLAGIEKPWLCWNISPAWCLVQQKLVKHVGWTPVVGHDPKYTPPALVDGGLMSASTPGFNFRRCICPSRSSLRGCSRRGSRS